MMKSDHVPPASAPEISDALASQEGAADPHGDVTALLIAGRAGDRHAYAQVYTLVYEHLRAVARAQRRRDARARADVHTLSTTAVVHEAWIRLADPRRLEVRDRAHFLAIAARAMRQVLVQHARRFKAVKRGAGAGHVHVEELGVFESDVAIEQRSDVLLSLDDALGRLGSMSPRLAQVVECRWFGGLTEEETAQALGVTDRTVRRDWVKARAWLHAELATARSAAL
jgi:RNA polymerase sigma factor (TIGR02999 family)